MKKRWPRLLILIIFGLLIFLQLATLAVAYSKKDIVIVEITYPLPAQTIDSPPVRPKLRDIEAMLIELLKNQNMFRSDYRPEIYDFNSVRYVVFAAHLPTPQESSIELAEKMNAKIRENLTTLRREGIIKNYDEVIIKPTIATRSVSSIRVLDIVAFVILIGMFIYWLPYRLFDKKSIGKTDMNGLSNSND